MVSNTIQFIYNDDIIKLKNPDPNRTILDFIRSDLKQKGTKEGCAEGGCGACTVVLGELKNKKLHYKSINSCISFLPMIDKKHLILIENLSNKKDNLHPIQEAMVKFHGSQCGFCTPGFVMSLFSMPCISLAQCSAWRRAMHRRPRTNTLLRKQSGEKKYHVTQVTI